MDKMNRIVLEYEGDDANFGNAQFILVIAGVDFIVTIDRGQVFIEPKE